MTDGCDTNMFWKGDLADHLCGYLYSIEGLQLVMDVPGVHPTAVERDDLLLDSGGADLFPDIGSSHRPGQRDHLMIFALGTFAGLVMGVSNLTDPALLFAIAGGGSLMFGGEDYN